VSPRYHAGMDYGDANIAAIGSVLADPGRCQVLTALGDGRALPASMLAAEAGVAPSTASEHLARLVDAGLLTVERHGRHRYFRIAGPEVAELLEAMARVAPPSKVRSLREGTRAHALRAARTCYDHLAGRVGVAVMDSMVEQEVLERDRFDDRDPLPPADHLASPGRAVRFGVTERGTGFFRDFGVDLAALPPRRPAIRYCIDWSEQRPHLAGALGAALTDHLFDLDWIRRAERSRAVHVTDQGRKGLAEVFGIDTD
jgi:DNA-binding transcriptional ArsR family regulator